MGSNREKSNIAIAILDKWSIWTYPISSLNSCKDMRKDLKTETRKDGVFLLWDVEGLTFLMHL